MSLVHWLMYAASVGGKERNWLAGLHCHGEEAFASRAVVLLKRSFRLKGAGEAGRTVEYT